MNKVMRASLFGLSILTMVPNIMYKQPKAWNIGSFFRSDSLPCGLPNFGTTCYFNSMMHALSKCLHFQDYIAAEQSDLAKILKEVFFYISNGGIDEEKINLRYKNLVTAAVKSTGEERSPSEALCYFTNLFGIPAKDLPEEINLDINGDDLFPADPVELSKLPAEPARYSYLYHWNRLGEIGGVYNSDPVTFHSRISAPRPGVAVSRPYLSDDFKLKCIICYSGNGTLGHYYVVKEHKKNWFKISDRNVEIAVNCEKKSELDIITELNDKYGTNVLMALYDYDPEYKIGV